MERIDPLTQERFAPARNNQRFASRTNRVRFHNIRANALRKELAAFNKPLHKNYVILSEIMEGKADEVFHWEFLRGKGFHRNIHTHLVKFENEHRVAIYQFIIVPKEKDFVRIVRI